MIKKIKYQEIDFTKYQHCIEHSLHRNWFAEKEILDVLCDCWELLVWGDYEYVMPLPIIKKFGTSIVLMPLFCQQLGIYGEKDVPTINEKFLKYLKKNYRTLLYFFNSKNQFESSLVFRKNYYIQKTDFKILRKNYFKGRKSTVKTAGYHQFGTLELNTTTINFIKTHYKGLPKNGDLQKLVNLLGVLDKKKYLKIFVSLYDSQITSMSLIVDHRNSLYLLGLITPQTAKQENGSSFLIDQLLQQFILNKNFDFMGGNIRGIEVFFKSFGAELQTYACINPSRKEFIASFFR